MGKGWEEEKGGEGRKEVNIFILTEQIMKTDFAENVSYITSSEPEDAVGKFYQ